MTHKLEGSKKALKIYEFYLDIENKIGSPGGYIQSVVYMNIADIYTEESEFGKAENFLNRALTLIDTNNYRFRKPRAHVQLAELYLRTGDIPKAIDNYLMAFDASKSIDAFDVVKNASASLAELYTSTGDTTLASSFAAMHTSVSDSLFSIETNQRIKILEARRKISEISREKEILEIRSNSQEERYRLLLVIFMLTVVSSCVVAYSYYKAKKKNQLLYHRTKDLAIEKIKKRKMIIHGNTEHPDISDHPKSSETTYMDEDLKNIILAKLERYEEKQFFLDPKCSLGTLSDELQTNQKYLSQVINNEKKSNFNNYINGLRINYLLDRLIEDPEFRNSKLGYIARASGFNNSNTFYSAFKKRLGILPSYFIKQLNEEEV
jgi:YesN/AraC family two-component response regulator